ncbi:MAG: alpha-hydroxy-acid oxidizing protein [Gammaproteobacteria bacterium]|nr:alpha-hydroxy-acid oxidizing protein [Gammaproteobacteria bacterium]MDH5800141.1 alpha-hydroxy-acid oxidizing protein [Gammaproteobacteria bacterium]
MPEDKILQRKLYSGSSFQRALSIAELRNIALRCVPRFAIEYVEGGAEDEQALQHNVEALAAYRFIPNTLVDTSQRHQRISLLGKSCNAPLVIAPTGLNGMLRYRGDVDLARAAARVGIPFTLSTVSNVSLENVAKEAAGRLWMQLYVMKDRAVARNIVERADKAGYEALVFTSDANVFGYREWDRRNYRYPGKLKWQNMLDVARHPRWVLNVLRHGIPWFDNIVEYMPPEARSASGGVAFFPKLFAPDISWEDVKWIRDLWPRKLLIKGVLSAEDARRAAEAGCDGIILTNHGGRQLDSCVAPIDVLPQIANAVADRMTVIVDSGFRRGADVVKALAMGANAVMIGRATLYGLAAGGEAGVDHALQIIMNEIDRTLGQLGCSSFEDLHQGMLQHDQNVGLRYEY